MKVKFKNSKELQTVLKTVENILKKTKIDSLQLIKLENINEKLAIIAMNQTMRIRYFVDEIKDIEGNYDLYDKTLISLLNVLDNEIEINENVIKNAKCEYEIPTIINHDYPEDIIPQIENRQEINVQEFKEGLEGVLYATYKSEYSIMSGVYVDGNKLVGIDGNRIFTKELSSYLDKIVLPKELVSEFLRLPFKEKVYISTFGQKIIIEDDNIQLVCNALSGDYPEYEQLLPRETDNVIEFKNKHFLNAINLILPVINQHTMRCNLKITKYEMFVFIEGAKKARTQIPISIKEEIDEPINVMFNVNYLIDMLKVNGENIQMLIHKNSPGYSFKDKNLYQYIMPMSI